MVSKLLEICKRHNPEIKEIADDIERSNRLANEKIKMQVILNDVVNHLREKGIIDDERKQFYMERLVKGMDMMADKEFWELIDDMWAVMQRS